MSSQTFDLKAPIPRGRVVIDASAGTGKTFAVAGIVTRLLVEDGIAIDEIVITTFTRAAARELRSRIRDRLVQAVAVLENDPSATDAGDPVVTAIRLTDDPAELTTRLTRARAALTDFDSASIGTIHSLCQRLLRLAGYDLQLDDEPDSNDRLIAEVINDLLVTEAVAGRTGFDAKRLTLLVAKALDNPRALLWVEDPSDSELQDCVTVVERVLDEVRRRASSTTTYDGLLYHAHRLFTDPAAVELRASVASRYRIAVVDEAQDTDPLQWELLSALFPAEDTDRALFVVGDPKQSIYSFRGADVDGYVQARDGVSSRFTLGRNFRSDQPLLDALNGLLGDATFGSGITYQPVDAPPANAASKLPAAEPVVEVIVTGRSDVTEDIADPWTFAVVQRTAQALATGRFTPEDIAIIVGSRYEARPIERALRQRGIPCVTSGTESVAKSAAAGKLRELLRGLDRPNDLKVARLVALGWFGTLTRGELIAGNADDLISTQEQLIQWAAVLRRGGVAALVETLLTLDRIIDRMVATGTLARHLTDLGHLAELLHERCGRGPTTPSEALAALAELEAMDEKSELVSRRIETDANAVQILTIHVAKGLEFPLVIVATQWRSEWSRGKAPLPLGRFTGNAQQRALYCGYLLESRRPAYDEAMDAVRTEFQAEQARLLYVAVTRAKHQLVLLYNPDETGALPTTRAFGLASPISQADQLQTALQDRLGTIAPRVRFTSGATVISEPVVAPQIRHIEVDPSSLAPARAPSPIRSALLRWSFTTMTSKRDRVSADERGGDDEFGAADAAPTVAAAAGPLSGLPAGAEFGTTIHSILEHTDFSAGDLDGELRVQLSRFANTPSLRSRHDELATGLAAVIHTPLGRAAPLDLRLADITRTQRMDELRFDFALVDDSAVRIREIGALLTERLTPSDPLVEYAQRLSQGALSSSLIGMLTGSVDLVVRHPSRAGEFLIADYKSNRLTRYDRPALVDAMVHHHYPLQGLLYSVALYRYLRWRLGESDPSPRIAGFAYLFIRGMTGNDTPRDADGRVNGVFHWQAPAGLIPALSDLLSGVATV
jgi:exodeoxyribonuclease V beta subunit